MPFLVSNTFDAAYSQIAKPWFAERAFSVFAGHSQSVVLVPNLSYAYALRARLAADSVAFAGVYVWTPGDAERFLATLHSTGKVADAATTRLLLSACAESMATPTSASVARDSGPLAESLSRLEFAGWSHVDLGCADLRPIGAALAQSLSDFGLKSIGKQRFEFADLSDQVAQKPFESLLMLGFHGGHWADYPTLLGFQRLAKNTFMVMREPRNDGLDCDSIWVESWESVLGASSPISEDKLIQDYPCYPFAQSVWAGTSTTPNDDESPLSLVVAADIRAQAEIAVTFALSWVARGGSGRIGILVPTTSALSVEIARQLEANEVHHWNDLGSFTPGFCEQPTWASFLGLLAEPSVTGFLAVLEAGAQPPLLKAEISRQARALLRDASTRSLSERLPVIAATLMTHEEDSAGRKVGEFLTLFPWLPDSAKASEHLTIFRLALDRMGWVEEADIWPKDMCALAELSVSRGSFLRWVAGHAKTLSRSITGFGAHPYARIVLTSYERADGQPWAYLIGCGQNEGVFPPPFNDHALLGEQTIYELNARVRNLNADATASDDNGRTVKQGHSLLLGPVEERWTVQQSFVGALEQAEEAVLICAQKDENAPGTLLRPGEYFTRLFEVLYGHAPSETEIAALAISANPSISHSPVKEVRAIYDHRRNDQIPFDEYSFGFRAGFEAKANFSASTAEALIDRPAEAWCRVALGVSLARNETDIPWSLAIGTWAHDWVATAAPHGEVTLRNGPAHFSNAVAKAATDHFNAYAVRFGGSPDKLPGWWRAAFAQAKRIASQLARSLDEVSLQSWPAFACEFKIPNATVVKVGGKLLTVRGRMDLVFFQKGGSLADALSGGCWLVDFKTGTNALLSGKRLADGHGLQLGIYGLGLEKLGAPSVGMSILKPGDALVVQIGMSDVHAQGDMLEWVAQLQDSGTFGQREKIRDEFSFVSDFPIATIPVPVGILEKKWALTHTRHAPELTA